MPLTLFQLLYFYAILISLSVERLGASELLESLTIGVTEPVLVPLNLLPEGLVADPELGLVRHEKLIGQLVHEANQSVRGLFETRAVRTPDGDLLLMFPEGNHYAVAAEKVNDMIAYRSNDNGKTWDGPSIGFDINYSQHGLIPLIPTGSKRIYAFGTQPIPSE